MAARHLAPLALLALAWPRAGHAAEDLWWGPDKALHFGASAVLAGGGYAASSLFLEPRWQRALSGGALALGAGLAKEGWDLAGHGDPSWKDLTWDLLGTGVGLSLALFTDLLLSGNAEPAATTSTAIVRF